MNDTIPTGEHMYGDDHDWSGQKRRTLSFSISPSSSTITWNVGRLAESLSQHRRINAAIGGGQSDGISGRNVPAVISYYHYDIDM
jgi:hypothetical protein